MDLRIILSLSLSFYLPVGTSGAEISKLLTPSSESHEGKDVVCDCESVVLEITVIIYSHLKKTYIYPVC